VGRPPRHQQHIEVCRQLQIAVERVKDARHVAISAIRAGSSPPPDRFTRRDTGHAKAIFGRRPHQLRSGCAAQPCFDIRAIQKDRSEWQSRFIHHSGRPPRAGKFAASE
jgi:hypothetical protein